MKNLQSFSTRGLSEQEATSVKGGASYNIFCEIYIGRQERLGETIDQAVIAKLMKWDQGLNNWIASQ